MMALYGGGPRHALLFRWRTWAYWSGSSKIFPVLTCIGSTVDLDPHPSVGTPIASNGRGRLILPFIFLAADEWRGRIPRHVPVHG